MRVSGSNVYLVIGIAGIPGSGKSTLATRVTSGLNALQPSIAIAVPMDGFHHPRCVLSQMPNPQEAHFRRGAAFTFDAPSFLSLVQAVREPLAETTPVVRAPSFDHAVKDPKPDDIPIYPANRVVVFEGNYLALDKPVWRDVAAMMDELWFVEVDFEVARMRLVRRHVEAGIVENEEAADRRVRESDLLNGREIVENRLEVNEIIPSQQDDAWAHS